jgi:hypothetical protein
MDNPNRHPTCTSDDDRNAFGTRRPRGGTPPAVAEQASLEDLRCEWRRLYRSEPPRISRDLLLRGIAYRLQELEHGGLSKTTRRKLKTLEKMFRTTGRVAPNPGVSLKPGARLVREWRGRAHTVTVTEDGFDYAGTSYPSLTRIAKKITGAHWSGPRFFGLLRDSSSAKDGVRV